MADVKWIKITTDIFDDEKILLIESMPDAYAIITCWFKLLCLAGKANNSGVFTIGKVAYTDSMLAAIFHMKESTVKMALSTFEQLEMVKIVDDVLTIPNWDKHQSLDAYERKKERDRQYQAAIRAKQRKMIQKSSDSQTTESSDIASVEEDKEKEIEREVEVDRDRDNTQVKKSAKTAENSIRMGAECKDAYNAICTSLPKCTKITDARASAVKARQADLDGKSWSDFWQIVNASDFLCGRNAQGWHATFDWCLKPSNFIKILEGTYENRTSNASAAAEQPLGRGATIRKMLGEISEDAPEIVGWVE